MTYKEVAINMGLSCLFWYGVCILSDYFTNFRVCKDINPDRNTAILNYRRINQYDPLGVANE